MGTGQRWELADLPESVRGQVVHWTAEVLPAVKPLPGPVRKIADFAPARRARAGGPALGAALSDDSFREAVAVQVTALVPEAHESTDGVAKAAVAWLQRSEGWEEVLTTSLEALRERTQQSDDENASLRVRLATLEKALRDVKEEHRGRLGDLRAENAQLRKRLGEARVHARASDERADLMVQELGQTRQEAAQQQRVAAKEIRRLRAQVETHDTESGEARRQDRLEREDVNVRARLLLDTLGEAVAGLRRELALPPTSHLPADRVDAVMARGLDADSLAARGEDGPDALEHLLALPRIRLLVDGYNVAKAAWPSSTLEAQRIRLVTPMGALVARTGAETTVVFDAQHSAHRAPTPVPRGVRVVFSPTGVIADDVIVDYVRAEPSGRVVLVVTDDRELATRVRGNGARVVGARALVALLAR